MLDIDYIALYRDTAEYSYTKRTAIAFFEYDDEWNGHNGLFAAIYYNDVKRLAYFKKRFTNASGRPLIFIAPDVSQICEVHKIENLHRYFQSRVISNWLILECGALVIPNLTASSRTYFEDMITGLESTEVAAINLIGHVKNEEKFNFSIEIAKYASKHLKSLKLIILFTTVNDAESIKQAFEAAVGSKIKILVPSNRAALRNKLLQKETSK